MHFAAFLLLVIGGLNWLLVGVFGWDISYLWGDTGHWLSRIIYIVIGLAAIYEIITHRSSCKTCPSKEKKEPIEDMSSQEGEITESQPENTNSDGGQPENTNSDGGQV